MENDMLKYVYAEKNILQNSNNPFIIKLHQAFQTPDKLFFILENGAKGDMQQHLNCEKRLLKNK